MKKLFIPLCALGFGVTLAVIIGQRMSTDAMAVVIGVAVGVAASIPTSLLLVAMLRREQRASRRNDEPPPMPYGYPQLSQPDIIGLDPAQFANQNARMLLPLAPLTAQTDGGLRRLRVLGDDRDW